MNMLRAVPRFAAFACLTLGLWLLHQLLRPLMRDHWAWRSRIFRAWGRGMLRVLGARVLVSGSPPQGPFLLVSNHLGYVDVALLAAHLGATLVAKQAVRGWPLMGRIVADMDTIFVDRADPLAVTRCAEAMARHLAHGHGVVLFPEGTSSPGLEVLPFHAPLLEPAVRAGVPVHTAAISYRGHAGDPPAHLSVAWWGPMAFFPHLWQLFKLRGFEATLRFGAGPIRCDNRKALARALHTEVCAQFTPLVGAEEFRCTTPTELLTTPSPSSRKAWV